MALLVGLGHGLVVGRVVGLAVGLGGHRRRRLRGRDVACPPEGSG